MTPVLFELSSFRDLYKIMPIEFRDVAVAVKTRVRLLSVPFTRWRFPPWWQPLRETRFLAFCLVYIPALSAGAFLQTWEISGKINSAPGGKARGRNIWGPPPPARVATTRVIIIFIIFHLPCCSARAKVRECTGYWQCFDTRLRRNGIWWMAYWKSILSRLHPRPSTLLGIKFRLLNIDGRRRSVSAR
jgi:hypothetical protein